MIPALLVISLASLVISAWCAWTLIGVRADVTHAHIRMTNALIEAVRDSDRPGHPMGWTTTKTTSASVSGVSEDRVTEVIEHGIGALSSTSPETVREPKITVIE